MGEGRTRAARSSAGTARLGFGLGAGAAPRGVVGAGSLHFVLQRACREVGQVVEVCVIKRGKLCFMGWINLDAGFRVSEECVRRQTHCQAQR